MKKLFGYAIAFLLIFNYGSTKVDPLDNESVLNKSKIIIYDKYAARFCNAKADNFFKGLDNEKTLKYSYYKYIGLDNKEDFSNGFSAALINQIKERCNITKEEEKEIKEIYSENKK
tara:strand:+ start:524 stop:871 length:348 start_codon:yes stop_codon:yes gene_type:complete